MLKKLTSIENLDHNLMSDVSDTSKLQGDDCIG